MLVSVTGFILLVLLLITQCLLLHHQCRQVDDITSKTDEHNVTASSSPTSWNQSEEGYFRAKRDSLEIISSDEDDNKDDDPDDDIDVSTLPQESSRNKSGTDSNQTKAANEPTESLSDKPIAPIKTVQVEFSSIPSFTIPARVNTPISGSDISWAVIVVLLVVAAIAFGGFMVWNHYRNSSNKRPKENKKRKKSGSKKRKSNRKSKSKSPKSPSPKSSRSKATRRSLSRKSRRSSRVSQTISSSIGKSTEQAVTSLDYGCSAQPSSPDSTPKVEFVFTPLDYVKTNPSKGPQMPPNEEPADRWPADQEPQNNAQKKTKDEE